MYSLKLRQSGEIMLWFDCWTTGSRHCSNSFTSSHNIQTSSFAINQFSLIHSFHFTKKGVTYTCFLARWVDKEIEMPAACFTAQLGGEAFLQRDLAPICSGQWGVCSIAPNFGKNLESYNCSIASFIQMFQSMLWGVLLFSMEFLCVHFLITFAFCLCLHLPI